MMNKYDFKRLGIIKNILVFFCTLFLFGCSSDGTSKDLEKEQLKTQVQELQKTVDNLKKQPETVTPPVVPKPKPVSKPATTPKESPVMVPVPAPTSTVAPVAVPVVTPVIAPSPVPKEISVQDKAAIYTICQNEAAIAKNNYKTQVDIATEPVLKDAFAKLDQQIADLISNYYNNYSLPAELNTEQSERYMDIQQSTLEQSVNALKAKKIQIKQNSDNVISKEMTRYYNQYTEECVKNYK